MTATIIASSYGNNIKEFMGYSYNAVGLLKKGELLHFILNEEDLGNKTEKFLNNPETKIMEVLARIFKHFEKVKKDIDLELAKNNANGSFKKIVELYPEYMNTIGSYNCFWRFLGNEETKGPLTRELINKIIREREIIARYYPYLEEKIKELANRIGKEGQLDGDLLRYLTINEAKEYCKTFKITKELLEECKKRREGAFVLFYNEQYKIITDKKDLDEINKHLFELDLTESNIIKGHPAHPGVITGKVFNKNENEKSQMKTGEVLVVHMTKPADMSLIKRCAAVVTDEGGILSHAVISSRELNKPCIIATKIATKVLKTGDLVEVDANKGIVRRIDNPTHYQSEKWRMFASRPTPINKRDFIKWTYLCLDKIPGLKLTKLLAIGNDQEMDVFVDKKEDELNYQEAKRQHEQKITEEVFKKYLELINNYKPHGKDPMEMDLNAMKEVGPILIYSYYVERLFEEEINHEKNNQTLQTNTHLRDKGAKIIYPLYDKAREFLENKFKNKPINYYTIEEIDKNLDEKEISNRKEFYVFSGTKEGTKIYTGEEAKIFLEKEGFTPIKTALSDKEVELKGLAGSKGKVKGQVKIVRNINDAKDCSGKIVVSRETIIEYTPFLKNALAIVTDIGGVSCHAVVTAREFGIPCVVGTKFATDLLKDGMEIEVDADKGIVKIIK